MTDAAMAPPSRPASDLDALRSALHLAVANFDLDEAKAALGAGADPKLADGQGRSALDLAAEVGNWKAIELLLPLSDASSPGEGGSTALMRAASVGHPRCAALLLEACDPNQLDARGRTALMLAARSASLECVEILLPATDARVRGRDGDDALRMALGAGRPDIAALVEARLALQDAEEIGSAIRAEAAFGPSAGGPRL